MVKTKRTMPVDAQFAAAAGMTPSEGRMDAATMARLVEAAAALLTTILLSGYMVAVG
jgi:hypothetical protein